MKRARSPRLPLQRASRKRPELRERRTQEAVIQHLMLGARPGVWWFAIPNEAVSDARTCAAMKGMGMLPGIADLCIMVPRARGASFDACFLELKDAAGKVSDDQAAFDAFCKAHGVKYAVAWSLDEALSTLATWGALQPSMASRWPSARRAAA